MLGAALVLAGCGGGGGGGSSGPVPQGTLQMSITDAPACYESVLVSIAKVRVHMDSATGDNDGGWKEIVPANAPVQVDLVNLTNGQLADLGKGLIDAGTYHQLRLVLADNDSAHPLRNAVKPIGGTLQPLKTPSAQESGLKVKQAFEVQPNTTSDMVLDFDACKSIVLTGSGQYLLKPVVRLGSKLASGIQGYVTTTMSLSSTTVSAQQNGTVVRSTVPDANGKFTLAYLPSGTYTVVITSDGRATGVVDSVPVGTSTLALNGTATSIVLPTSVMNTVTGTVTATSISGSTTSTVAVDDAFVRALQPVGTIKAVEVGAAKVDDDQGRYTMRLPAGAAVKAPYAASGLTFTPDTANPAGQYTIEASAEGRKPQSGTADVSSGPATINFGF